MDDKRRMGFEAMAIGEQYEDEYVLTPELAREYAEPVTPNTPSEEPRMSVTAEELAVGQEIGPAVKLMTLERMSRPLMAGSNPIHYDPTFAQKAGLSAPIATGVISSAFLSEMLTKAFGVAWIRGGWMDVKFIRPIYAGDTVTARGRITGKSETSTGMRIALNIWCETQRGEPVTVGTASVVVH